MSINTWYPFNDYGIADTQKKVGSKYNESVENFDLCLNYATKYEKRQLFDDFYVLSWR